MVICMSVNKLGNYGGVFDEARNGAGSCPLAKCYDKRFGPHWYNSKITWANIVNAVLDADTKYNKVTILTWLER